MEAFRHRHPTWAAPAGLFICSVALALALIEVIASAFVPPWPARALRSHVPDVPGKGSPFNTWGMRDKEHSVDLPRDVKARFAFVGDSFVEFEPLSRTLPQA